ncbi:atherin-like [Choloepus didactylus]|uniref:atherin-like n=1 Tax=Choloepus didactylus TaxID=27675 RepID=UPI00189F162F|nr:atherin-like [Choloepus didactylus]
MGASPSPPPPPLPLAHPLRVLSSKSGPRSHPLLLPSSSLAFAPRRVPRAPAHLPRGLGRCRPVEEAPRPWPISAPATALARVAAAAGSSTAALRRFQVGPRLPIPPLPAAPAAPSGPLLSPLRWDGRAMAAAGALTTPPAGNLGPCSARGRECQPFAARLHPRAKVGLLRTDSSPSPMTGNLRMKSTGGRKPRSSCQLQRKNKIWLQRKKRITSELIY